MRWTDRLNLPQKIVLVIALGLALGTVGGSVTGLGPGVGGYTSFTPEPLPYRSDLSVAFSQGFLLTGWDSLIIWLVLIIIWALISIRILRSAAERSPRV